MRTISRGRLLVALILAVACAAAAAAIGQLSQDPSWRPRIWVGGNDRWSRTPPKWTRREQFDGAWTYCLGFYDRSRREAGGGGWDTDFPGAENNSSVRLAELTDVRINLHASGQGRPIVAMTRSTDIRDTWEHESERKEYFHIFSPNGCAVGVNTVLSSLAP